VLLQQHKVSLLHSFLITSNFLLSTAAADTSESERVSRVLLSAAAKVIHLNQRHPESFAGKQHHFSLTSSISSLLPSLLQRVYCGDDSERNHSAANDEVREREEGMRNCFVPTC
jgi:hypothetical protein